SPCSTNGTRRAFRGSGSVWSESRCRRSSPRSPPDAWSTTTLSGFMAPRPQRHRRRAPNRAPALAYLQLVKVGVPQEAPDLIRSERAHHRRPPLVGPVVVVGPGIAPDLPGVALVDPLAKAPVRIFRGGHRLLVVEDH